MIDEISFQSFPALYIASDHYTSLSEKFQKNADLKDSSESLSRNDFSLTPIESYSVSRLHGSLESVLDISISENLRPFLRIIKKFVPPIQLTDEARELNLRVPNSIRNIKQLKKTLLDPDCLASAALLNVPSNSQIFGALARAAGIQAILYPSKFSAGLCLAIFPDNFLGKDSYVELTDAAQDGTVTRLDGETRSALR